MNFSSRNKLKLKLEESERPLNFLYDGWLKLINDEDINKQSKTKMTLAKLLHVQFGKHNGAFSSFFLEIFKHQKVKVLWISFKNQCSLFE